MVEIINVNMDEVIKAAEEFVQPTPVITIIEGAFTILLPDQCFGCGKAPEFTKCAMYPGREHLQHTRLGGCAGRTHDRTIEIDKNGKSFIDPLKASKKKAKGVI